MLIAHARVINWGDDWAIMKKKTESLVKARTRSFTKIPRQPKIIPADLAFFIDPEIQLLILQREMTRTLPKIGFRRTATESAGVRRSPRVKDRVAT